ncbi:MAG: hypothetical protein LBV43_07015 [Prevotella sp.]|jgi:hypothetical protein|nr:hypothetical protein [Prevotella sp.]
MNLLDYIKGQRKGSDAHRIEKNSMRDPFLYEAIEGFDSVNDDHIKRIGNIQKQIRAKSNAQIGYRQVWRSVAAVLVLVIGLGWYFLSDYHKSDLHAQNTGENNIIDIYVPKAYYEENIVPIAQQNAEVARKAYKPTITKFRVESNIIDITQEELDMLAQKKASDEDDTVLEIYIPESK